MYFSQIIVYLETESTALFGPVKAAMMLEGQGWGTDGGTEGGLNPEGQGAASSAGYLLWDPRLKNKQCQPWRLEQRE